METTTLLNKNAVQANLGANWGWVLVAGALTICLGFLAIGAPLATAFTLNIFLGWLFAVAGILKVVHAIQRRNQGGFMLALLSAVVTFGLGYMLLAYPLTGVMTLTLLVSTFLVMEGVLKTMWAFSLRPASGWGWTLVAGIADVVLGAMIWAQWPSSAVWVIGLLVGINLVMTGWAMIALSLVSRRIGSLATA